jgi:hypothetical protein
MATTWIRVTYEGNSEGLFVFVAQIEDDLREVVFNRSPDDFVRFNYVRWLEGEEDDVDRPEFTKNEEDDESGSDHFIFLRQRTIIQIEPIRDAFVEFWNATVGEGGALW